MLRYLKQLENYGKVYAVVTIVLFTGEYRWTNPKSIYESIEAIPEKMKDYIQGWNAHIVDMKDINVTEVDEEETRMLVEGIQMVYEIKKNSTRFMENLGMTQEVALYVATVTGFSE